MAQHGKPMELGAISLLDLARWMDRIETPLLFLFVRSPCMGGERRAHAPTECADVSGRGLEGCDPGRGPEHGSDGRGSNGRGQAGVAQSDASGAAVACRTCGQPGHKASQCLCSPLCVRPRAAAPTLAGSGAAVLAQCEVGRVRASAVAEPAPHVAPRHEMSCAEGGWPF